MQMSRNSTKALIFSELTAVTDSKAGVSAGTVDVYVH